MEAKSNELLRLETFSDGIFAIAITLLILELVQILHSNNKGELLPLLLRNWKSFLVFLIGFLTILVCWINHHLVLSYAEKMDSKLFWVNGFVLLMVTFTPFPTAILAEYLGTESHTALAVFGFNYFMMSLAAYCISAYIYNHLGAKENSELLYYHTLLYKYSIVYTFLILFICFISVALSLVFYAILFLVFAFPKESSRILLNQRKKKKKAPAAQTPTLQNTGR